MGIFPGRRKSAEETAGPAGPEDERGAKVRALKPQERLSTVIKESTPHSAMEAIRENERFLIEGGAAGVVLLLDVFDIGGLSKKHSKDEDKGGIASQIGADHIRVVVSEQMLEDQYIGIIPDSETLDRMKEFRLLMEAPYRWARVDLTGTQIDIRQSKPATFTEALRISQGVAEIEDVLSSDEPGEPTVALDRVADPADEEVSSPEENTVLPEVDTDPGGPIENDMPFGEEEEEAPVSTATVDESDEEVPEGYEGDDFDPAAEDEADSYADIQDEDDEENFDPDAEIDYEDDEYTAEDEDSGEYGWVQPAEQIDGAAVRDSIARRFTGEELELLVDLEPFQRQFGTEEPLALFEIESDVSDWLGQQIAYLQEQANADLRDFHRKNVLGMQEMYVRLASRHAEAVLSQVDVNKEDLRYGRLMARAKERFDNARQDAPREIAARQTALHKSFTERMEDYANTAAEQARTTFRERHSAQLDHEVSAVPAKVAQEQEAAHAEDRRETLAMRAHEAQTAMDLGITRVLASLTEQNEANMEASLELHRRWSERITEFLDAHRKEDVARIEALAEKQAREDEVGRIRAEMTAQLEIERRESASQLEALNAELRRTRENADSHLQARESELRGLLDAEIERTEAQRRLVVEAEANVEERVHDRYKARIEDLEADKQRAREEKAEIIETSTRKDKLLITLMVALALVAVFAGVIIGFLWSGSLASGEASTAAIMLPVVGVDGPGVS